VANPDEKDYEAIHRNMGGGDLINLGVNIENGNMSTSEILDYVAQRTDVAFRRGYWKGKKVKAGPLSAAERGVIRQNDKIVHGDFSGVCPIIHDLLNVILPLLLSLLFGDKSMSHGPILSLKHG